MRWAIRAALALGVLIVLGVVGLAVALPRLAQSEAVRERIRDAARDATGEELAWRELSFGLLPPRLVVRGASLHPRERPSEPSLAAESVALRVALLPLLARAVVIDSLVVEGVSVKLVRTARGIELPVAAPSQKAEREPKAERSEAESDSRAGPTVAVRQVVVRGSRLALEDRSVSPPVVWQLEDVEAQARGKALDAPIDIRLAARLAGGGTLRATGTARLDGALDLEATLDGVELAPIAPYLAKGQRVAGRLSGTVHAVGPAAAPEKLEAKLVLADGDVSLDEILLRGRLDVRADLAGAFEQLRGRFDVDATQAELVYGEAFRKPPGTRATATGRIVPRQDGSLGFEEVELRVRNLEGKGSASLGPRTRIALDAASFSLDGWGELVPPLASWAPSGSLSLPQWEVVTSPLELRGRAILDGVRVSPPERAPLTVVGTLEGTGDAIRGRELRITVADQVVTVDAELTGLGRQPRARVQASAAGADTNALLVALAGLKDTLYGPLTLTSDVSIPLGAAEPLQALTGPVRLEIGRGRLKGVSLLRGTFERLGTLGEAALLAGALGGGRTLQRFYDDEFESITGSFRLAEGFARTDDLRLVYRHYTVDLQGGLGLADQSLDLRGKLTIEEEVDAALAGAVASQGAPAAEETPAAAPAGRKKVIPLARVRGTLQAPRVDLSPEAVAALAGSYTFARKRDEWERRLDESLGEGSGKQILDTLDGILGGRSRKP